MWNVQKGSLGLLLGLVTLAIAAPIASLFSPAQAQVITPGKREPDYPKVLPPDPKRIPPNLLEDQTPDPLYPDRTVVLGELGQAELRSKLDAMSQEANQLFAQKKGDEAFKLWFRELRLRRFLGDREEIFALARIGEIAWQNNRTPELRDITERLQRIQIKLATMPESVERAELNEYLGISYQILRSPQLALSIYEPRLQQLRDAQASLQANPLEGFKTLNSIGLIHLDWFRYEKASRTYGELLQLAKLTGDRSLESLYLIQLIYIAEQRRTYPDAIASLENLIQIYSTQPQIQPALHLRLAENQDADRAFDAAEKNYQKAFTLSQALNQSSYGSTALFKLGDLYRRTDRPAQAAQVYDYLVDAEQATYNLYGAMKAADLLGQMRSAQKDYPRAVAAYEKAGAIGASLAVKSEPLQKRLEAARKNMTITTPKS
jgi:tetratricopeptide (TPR) repeat protein